MAPGDGKPHIATVDRVGTSTEHVCASSFSSRTLSTAWPRRAASRVPDWCSQGYRRVTRPPVRCAVTDYPGTGKDGPHSHLGEDIRTTCTDPRLCDSA